MDDCGFYHNRRYDVPEPRDDIFKNYASMFLISIERKMLLSSLTR